MAVGYALADRVGSLVVDGHGLGESCGGGGVIPGVPLQAAEPDERVGLTEAVTGVARGGDGALLQRSALIPVTTSAQEAANGGRDGYGVRRPPMAGGVSRRGVYISALGLQPGRGLREGGQVRDVGRRMAGRRTAVGALPLAEMLAGGEAGVRVIVQQAGDGSVAVRGLVGGRERAGVLAEQVVQLVPSGRGLGQQMLVIQLI